MDGTLATKRLSITRVITETPDTKTFVLEPLDGWAPVYQPGQFITLIFNTRHGEKRRSYSISSSAILGEPLAITVKKVLNGEFSRLLVSQARVGDILLVSGISGLFVLPADLQTRKQYFFIAAGSGITPCLPMLKTLLRTTGLQVVLIYSNRSVTDCIFYEQLNHLALEFSGRFRIHYFFSDIFDYRRSRLSNFMLQQLLDEYLVVPEEDAQFYICGPFEYMRTVQITLLGRIPPANILKENFNSMPRVVLPVPPDTRGYFVTIRLNGQIHKIWVQFPLSILATAKKNKLTLPYSCEAGRCGSCLAICTKGQVWMAYNEVLTDEEVSRGAILACQGFPIGGDAEIIF